ncbi:MAG: hypothetical protein JRH20_29585 [Deltaproteobacteria bacterium]|nr:hypothetical protein [Deltaproteobacteria bacterium]
MTYLIVAGAGLGHATPSKGLADPPPPDPRSGLVTHPTPSVTQRSHAEGALAQLRNKHASFKRISDTQTARFVDLMKKEQLGLTVYVAENSILKDLNDKVLHDYDLVTTLCNVHKAIVHRLVMKDPQLRPLIAGQYHDFKGVAFAFRSESAATRLAVRKLHRKAGDIFAKILARTSIRDKISGKRGISGDPRHWYGGGIGSTYDQAGAAARLSRSRYRPHKRAVIFEFSRVERLLDAREAHTERLRSRLSQLDKRLLVELPGRNNYTLNVGLVDIVRKAHTVSGGLNKYIAHIKTRISRRFGGAQVSPNQVFLIRDYFAVVDSFSAKLLVKKRVEIDLGQAQHNVLSIDLKGQGARNHFETQVSLFESRLQGARVALKATRVGEDRATAEMLRAATHIDNVIAATYGAPSVDDAASGLTGDDKRYASPRKVKAKDRKLYVSGLQGYDRAGMFRSTDVALHYADTGRRVPAEQRSALVNDAEGVLKAMDTRLEGTKAGSDLSHALLHLRLYPREKAPNQVALSVVGEVKDSTMAALGRKLKLSVPKELAVRGRIERVSKVRVRHPAKAQR